MRRHSFCEAILTHVSATVALNLPASFGLTNGVWIVVFIGFLAYWEKKRSLTDILNSVRFKKAGLGKSIFWAPLRALSDPRKRGGVVTTLFSAFDYPHK